MEIAVDGAEAAVIAIDGIAVPPFAAHGWLLGPAMRVDLVVRAPAEGGVAHLVDRRGRASRCRSSASSAPARRARRAPFDPRRFAPAASRSRTSPPPRRLDFVFASAGAADGRRRRATHRRALFLGSLCLASDDFWTINGAAWPGTRSFAAFRRRSPSSNAAAPISSG